jgi:hypothetical protein
MHDSAAVSMNDILFLIECFEGYGPECNGTYLSGAEYMEQFFRLITVRPLPYLACVKMALTIHLILYEF